MELLLINYTMNTILNLNRVIQKYREEVALDGFIIFIRMTQFRNLISKILRLLIISVRIVRNHWMRDKVFYGPIHNNRVRVTFFLKDLLHKLINLRYRHYHLRKSSNYQLGGHELILFLAHNFVRLEVQMDITHQASRWAQSVGKSSLKSQINSWKNIMSR